MLTAAPADERDDELDIVQLSPDEQAELDEATAEAEEDAREGRLIAAAQVLVDRAPR